MVAILGVTYTCDFEPVAELDRINAITGLDVPIQVDAASGGFIAPFLQPELVRDFRFERVASINTLGRKYGLTPGRRLGGAAERGPAAGGADLAWTQPHDPFHAA